MVSSDPERPDQKDSKTGKKGLPIMRALVCETLGPVNSHRVQEIPDPVPGKRQVAVRVHAGSISPTH